MISCDGITDLEPIYHMTNATLRLFNFALILTFLVSAAVVLWYHKRRPQEKWPTFLKWMWALIPMGLLLMVVQDISFAMYNKGTHDYSDAFSHYLDMISAVTYASNTIIHWVFSIAYL